ELATIPGLWAAFAPHFGSIDGQVGYRSFGLCRPLGDGRMKYMAGVEVETGAAPADLEIMEVAPQRCAVWTHEGHISDLRRTYAAIFDRGLKDAGLAYGEGVEVELYDERFDAKTGTGSLEIWIPIA
ncbi:MAG: GyrI-like domain-containing protein, partial [Pseudomonadota bacterium]